MRGIPRALVVTIGASLALTTACSSGSGGGAPSGTSASAPSGAVTLWDYYGESTPLKDVLARFAKDHPEINVTYEAYSYDAIGQKFPVAAASSAAPDLATIDMTLIPSYAGNGLLADLSKISGGKLNGKDMSEQYSKGANEAMRYGEATVAAMYDFDAYALYYRKDLLDAAKLPVPTTYDELVTTAKTVAKGTGSSRTNAVLMPPSVFHFAGSVVQHGGSLLSSDLKKASFNDGAGVAALEDQKKLLDAGGLYWGPANGDYIAGIADGRIAMFVDGPYMMGILKSGAADQAGKWGVAPWPSAKQPGSYLGGTGLVVPKAAKNPAAAWVLAQYLLRPENQELLYTKSGAAPATLAGLDAPSLTKADPYFSGQVPFTVFKDSMASAVHFPYVDSWADIQKSLSVAIEAVYLGKESAQDALNKAAKATDTALGG